MTKPKQKTNTTSRKRKMRETLFESDSTYLLKLVCFTLLGTLWIRFNQPVMWMDILWKGIPLGLPVGLLLVRKFEHHQEDRKLWYAILIVVTIIGVYLPIGLFI